MDIIYVTYNSQKWVKKCFNSLLNARYDLSQIHIYVVDNASSDRTIELLEEMQERFAGICSFEILKETRNYGFGKANNLGFQRGNSDIVCFFNIDTELLSDTLTYLECAIKRSSDKTALWELRQFPYEHPKIYDVFTHETDWSSAAAFAVRREIYEGIGGFDEGIFMYAEDVDLSWRIRSYGYKLQYVPDAVIMHYSYEHAASVKPLQYIYGIVNNLLLRYRFGNWIDILTGHMLFWKCVAAKPAFYHSRKYLMQAYIKHFSKINHFMEQGFYRESREFVPYFRDFNYSKMRRGAFYKNEVLTAVPIVTIIIRNYGKLGLLRKTLITLRNQTYPNLEILIMSEKKDSLRRLTEMEFNDLNIVSESPMDSLKDVSASGKYLNILDYSLVYADHVEVMVNALIRSGRKMVCTNNFENSQSLACLMFEKSILRKYGDCFQSKKKYHAFLQRMNELDQMKVIRKTTIISEK